MCSIISGDSKKRQQKIYAQYLTLRIDKWNKRDKLK